MNRTLIEEAVRIATGMAAERGVDLDPVALERALIAVAGAGDGQDNPAEMAEDALELLGKAQDPSASRRGRRPF
jgi:hypothetical protein